MMPDSSYIDRVMAGWYFDHYVAHILRTPDMSDEGMEIMRKLYIEGCVENAEALFEVRKTYRLKHGIEDIDFLTGKRTHDE